MEVPTELTDRLRQRIAQAKVPPVAFDILSPSREGSIGELYEPLRWIAMTPPLTYADMYKNPNFFSLSPNVLSTGVKSYFSELTSDGTFRTYRVVANDPTDWYELVGISPQDFPDGTDFELLEEQAVVFLRRAHQILEEGRIDQPIEVLGPNATIPEDPDLVKENSYRKLEY